MHFTTPFGMWLLSIAGVALLLEILLKLRKARLYSRTKKIVAECAKRRYDEFSIRRVRWVRDHPFRDIEDPHYQWFIQTEANLLKTCIMLKRKSTGHDNHALWELRNNTRSQIKIERPPQE